MMFFINICPVNLEEKGCYGILYMSAAPLLFAKKGVKIESF